MKSIVGKSLNRRELIAGVSALTASQGLARSCPAVPASRSGSFLVLGDWGRKANRDQVRVAEQMAAIASDLKPSFVATTGDNFYKLGVQSATDAHWRTSFDEVYSAPSLQCPWFPTLGNHDYGGDVFAQIERSNRCDRWSMEKRWYTRNGKDHGLPNVDLFFIDTVVWTGGEKFPFDLFGTSVTAEDQYDQRRWLENQLILSKAPIKIVLGHYPIYSIGKHGGSMKMWDLDQLLRRAGVAAYICGHDHCTYHIEASGMHYICSGGGAQALDAFTGDRVEPHCVIKEDCIDRPGELPRPRWITYRLETGFISCAAVGPDVRVTMYDGEGKMYQWFDISAPNRT